MYVLGMYVQYLYCTVNKDVCKYGMLECFFFFLSFLLYVFSRQLGKKSEGRLNSGLVEWVERWNGNPLSSDQPPPPRKEGKNKNKKIREFFQYVQKWKRR